MGICTRQGLGKLRHLDTHTLWIQQAVRLRRVDLRKVAGELNPADLMTKHSLGRERLEKLVTLHGCKYLDGRAETAPLLRHGSTDRTTTASADRAVDAIDIESVEDPIMPHLTHHDHDLDTLYPPIIAPADDMLDDLCEDTRDPIYQHGLDLAKEIQETMHVKGRVRRQQNDE